MGFLLGKAMGAKSTLRQNRREFLGWATAGAAAVALPEFVPGTVFAGEGRPGANERITVGIIGMGVRGNQLLMNIPADGQVAAVAEPHRSKLAASIEKHRGRWTTYADYRRLIEQRDLDAVIVCPTDPHHVLASMLACAAGKDVYVEKPLSLYVNEGRALVKAARRYRRVVQTGTQQRTMEMNRFACEFVRDGGIGKIRWVEMVNFPSSEICPGFPAEPIPEGLDWDLWQGPCAERPYNSQLHEKWWGRWRDYAGHMMTFVGAHAFDMLQYALGADDTGPVEFEPFEAGTPSKLRFRYANGIEVRMIYEDNVRGPRLGAIFVGEKCKIEINRNKFTTNPKDFIKDGPDPQLAQKWEGDGWVAKGHVENWFHCIRTREKPNADVEIGHRSATICHLCNITRWLDRPIRWDPAEERIIGDDEAAALLDRPRRKGWELPKVD